MGSILPCGLSRSELIPCRIRSGKNATGRIAGDKECLESKSHELRWVLDQPQVLAHDIFVDRRFSEDYLGGGPVYVKLRLEGGMARLIHCEDGFTW
jgi:hypothetical protein